jgi:hypothetical protein
VNSPSNTVNSPSGSGAAKVGGQGTAQAGGAGAAKTNARVGVAKTSAVGVAKSNASPAKTKSKAGGNSNDEYRDTIAEGKYIFLTCCTQVKLANIQYFATKFSEKGRILFLFMSRSKVFEITYSFSQRIFCFKPYCTSKVM